ARNRGREDTVLEEGARPLEQREGGTPEAEPAEAREGAEGTEGAEGAEGEGGEGAQGAEGEGAKRRRQGAPPARGPAAQAEAPALLRRRPAESPPRRRGLQDRRPAHRLVAARRGARQQ